jgi:hypothetical protein
MTFHTRFAKPWGSFRKGAANLGMVASDSCVSKGHSHDHARVLLSGADD